VSLINIQPLTAESFRPYGWILGKTINLDGSIPAFSNTETDFWQEHIFDSGVGGETQVLWVDYRNKKRELCSLEMHKFTQQAVIPLTGEIIQIVAESQHDGSPQLASIRAFRIQVGKGICMRAGCWHTTRVDEREVRCLMLTRSSTTNDLVAHLRDRSPLIESAIAAVDAVTIASQ
jgi:ureidoglycolate lyase